MEHRRVAFLDRDGVINKKMPEGDYVKSWEEFRFLPGVLGALRQLKESGFLVVVVTNQRCVARGILTEEELGAIHAQMCAEVESAGGKIDAIYHCPHEIDEECDCRKPKPGMLLRAIADLTEKGIEMDRAASFVVGDSLKDVLAGKAAGLFTVKVAGSLDVADTVSKDLATAVGAICAHGGYGSPGSV